jgi:glycine/D-amino acid oxidase-like deaminating enzyme
MRYDVVVLGDGLAGLSAARDLVHRGADIVGLAARGRAGGREPRCAWPKSWEGGSATPLRLCASASRELAQTDRLPAVG